MGTGAVPNQRFYGWNNVIILFVFYCLLYGVVFYGFNVIFPAMLKAMKWSRGDASVGHTIRTLMVGVTAPVVAYMVNRWGSRNTLIPGALICITGLGLVSQVSSLWQWTLLWGVVMGLGFSLGGFIPVQTNATYWFTKRRGLAMGLIMTGAGVGGFFAQPIFTWLIKETGSWQIGWLCAGAILIPGSILLIWLKSKPSDVGQHPDGIHPEQAKAETSSARRISRTYKSTQNWDLKEVLRTYQFWFMLFCFITLSLPIYLFTTHGVLHMMDKGYKPMQAAYALSMLVLISGFARFPVGWLADYIEARWLMLIFFIGYAGSLVVFWQAPSLPAIIAASCVFGFCFGGQLVLMAIIVGNYFGPASFASINGVTVPCQTFCSSTIPILAGYVFDFNKSYDLAFIILISLSSLAILATLVIAPPVRAKISEKQSMQETESVGAA